MAFIIVDQQEEKVVASCSAFQRIRSTHRFKAVARMLALLLVGTIGCVAFVPWQQSISGTGKVAVYAPMDRPQNIEALISGRIDHWHVKEGQRVKKGQLLVDLKEIDPKYLDPAQLERLNNQKEALLARRDATLARIEALKSQVAFLAQSRQAALPSAQLKVQQAQSKVLAAQQAVTAAMQNQTTASLNKTRLEALHQQGLRSTRDRELAEQSLIEAQTKVAQAEAYLQVARQDQAVSGFDQSKVNADTAASLSSTQAMLATAYETLASTENDLAKLQVDLENLKQRYGQRQVRAPKSGILVRILSAGRGETVTEGDILATLVPEDADRAVALIISDNDAPLVSVGRPVRLQFAGWPALQFSGWPSVAVGTFAGRVSVIDAVDDGTSRYRVWVTPDKALISTRKEQPWPSARYLRPGSEALGWIMLDTVPLWFELWRQFNAFPPTVNPEVLGARKEENRANNTGTPDKMKPPKKK